MEHKFCMQGAHCKSCCNAKLESTELWHSDPPRSCQDKNPCSGVIADAGNWQVVVNDNAAADMTGNILLRVNITDRFAGTFLDCLIQEKLCNNGRE